MITVRELMLQQIMLQAKGSVVIKQYEEENDNYIILDEMENEYHVEDWEADFLDFEVTHIYPDGDDLIIEVKER